METAKVLTGHCTRLGSLGRLHLCFLLRLVSHHDQHLLLLGDPDPVTVEKPSLAVLDSGLSSDFPQHSLCTSVTYRIT